MALELPNFNRFVVMPNNTGPLTKNFRGANAGASRSKNIRGENCFCSTNGIAGGNFFDEEGNIDACGTSGNARSVKAEEAPQGFGNSSTRAQRRRLLVHQGIGILNRCHTEEVFIIPIPAGVSFYFSRLAVLFVLGRIPHATATSKICSSTPFLHTPFRHERILPP